MIGFEAKAWGQKSEEVDCAVAEDFVVSDVKRVLLSMGRLLRGGWTYTKDEESVGEAGTLASPDGMCRAQVH